MLPCGKSVLGLTHAHPLFPAAAAAAAACVYMYMRVVCCAVCLCTCVYPWCDPAVCRSNCFQLVIRSFAEVSSFFLCCQSPEDKEVGLLKTVSCSVLGLSVCFSLVLPWKEKGFRDVPSLIAILLSIAVCH